MDLVNHAYASDRELVQTLLSSGDFFPGFYRFTMGDRNYEKGQLTPSGLVGVFLGGHTFNRDRWTAFTRQRHKTANIRSAERSDMAIYELLDVAYYEWMVEAKSYDIAVIEIDNGPDEIALDTTYFLMGSFIRFTDTHVLVSYDLLRGEWLDAYEYPFDEAKAFIKQIYGASTKDFFLPSDCVATLEFDGSDIGELRMSDETVARVLTIHHNSVIIASNRDASAHLPIRWAKDILLTNVVDYDQN